MLDSLHTVVLFISFELVPCGDVISSGIWHRFLLLCFVGFWAWNPLPDICFQEQRRTWRCMPFVWTWLRSRIQPTACSDSIHGVGNVWLTEISGLDLMTKWNAHLHSLAVDFHCGHMTQHQIVSPPSGSWELRDHSIKHFLLYDNLQILLRAAKWLLPMQKYLFLV